MLYVEIFSEEFRLNFAVAVAVAVYFGALFIFIFC
jgi:hypothetical protein